MWKIYDGNKNMVIWVAIQVQQKLQQFECTFNVEVDKGTYVLMKVSSRCPVHKEDQTSWCVKSNFQVLKSKSTSKCQKCLKVPIVVYCFGTYKYIVCTHKYLIYFWYL